MRIEIKAGIPLAWTLAVTATLGHAASETPGSTHITPSTPAIAQGSLAIAPSDRAMPTGLRAGFVENRGQWNTSARFVAWTEGMVATLETNAIRLRAGQDRASSVALMFEGAVRGDAVLVGEDQRRGHYNFFLGSDSTRWRSKVPTFGSVLYRGLYDGVDLRVRKEDGRLEYDLLLQPGAEVEQMVFRADGASKLVEESDGSLSLHTSAGSIRQTPPRTWQVLPSGETQFVESRFRIIDERRYGFEVTGRNPQLALVIDPGLEWSTFLGGGDREEVHGLALARDGSGDVVVAGSTWSDDFPDAPPGALGVSPLIAFVARVNATGSDLVYVTLFGGTNGNVSYGYGLTLDATSAPVVVGETNAADFPTTAGAYQEDFNEPSETINRGWDAFVTRFDATGSQMVFSTFLGAAPIFDPTLPGSMRGGEEGARAVVIDASDSVIVTGRTTSENFPTTAGAYDRTLATLAVPVSGGTVHSWTDIFVSRLNPTGTQLTYSTFLGGQSDDIVGDMVIDPQGVLTIVGTEAPIETFDAQGNRTDHGIPFPTTPDAIANTHLGASDMFLARLRPDGTGLGDLKYGTIFGGDYIDDGTGIALDPNNSELITICGNNRSWDFPTTAGAWRRAPNFMADGVPYYSGHVVRFRFPASGNGSLEWSTLITGTATGVWADSVVIDPSGEVIVVGSDIAGLYPTTERSYKRLPAKGGFVSRFSADGKTQLYSTLLHKPSGVLVVRLRAVSTGTHAVIVAGSTLFTDYPTTPGAFDRVFGSDGTSDGFHTFDGFVSKLTLDPNTTTDTAATAPALVSPADGAIIPLNGSLTLDWTDVNDESGVQYYQVEVNSNADFLTGFSFFNIAQGSFTVSQATAGTSQEGIHYWRVRTLDGVNNFSPWSPVRKFTVGAPSWTNFSAVGLTPEGVVGGSTIQGKLHIQNTAPSGGQVYTLSSNNTAAATVPASVTVPAGASSATFTVTTKAVSKSTPVQLTVWSEGNGEHPVLWVDPAAPGAVTLSALTLNPTSVIGGSPSTGTATLSAAAPAGGQVVTLSSSNSVVASVPSSVTVSAGATSATFTVTTTSVTSATSVTITGVSGGTTRTAVLTVNPSGGGGGFNSPTTNAADTGGDGNGFQSNPSNAHADDTASASDTNSGTGTGTSCTSTGKDRHRFYNYNFAIPTGSTITGIEVRLDARADRTSNAPKMCVELSWDGGVSWTAAKSTATLGTSMATFTLGSSTDTWGRTWSAGEFGNTSFRARVINVASSTQRDFFLDWIAVRPHFTSGGPATLSSVSLSPSSVEGGSPSTGTATLTSAAPTGGAVVTLTSSNTAVATTPASVTVPAGATSATFTVSTSVVTTSTSVTISGTYGGTTRSASLTVTPKPACVPTTCAAQGKNCGTIDDGCGGTLTCGTCTPPQTCGGGGIPNVCGGGSATLTVTATGRSGERVTSSPAGINVAVGQTQSASFAVGTLITLSATNQRDVIWSGVCSSNGQKQKSCTFTLNANGSETANVQ